MILTTFDLSKSVIGFIIGFQEGRGRTGYQVKMLVRSQEVIFDATEEVYLVKDTTEFFPYPCLGEVMFMAQFNCDGVLDYLINLSDITLPENPIPSGLVMGTYAMFKKKIDEKTPKFGDILSVNGNTVTLNNYDSCIADGSICHSVYKGVITPHDGFSFELAQDTDIYLWDWSSALQPFAKCSREEAIERKYVTRMSLGSIEDIPDTYWLGFYSTKGNKDVIDTVKCFKNKAPGWE